MKGKVLLLSTILAVGLVSGILAQTSSATSTGDLLSYRIYHNYSNTTLLQMLGEYCRYPVSSGHGYAVNGSALNFTVWHIEQARWFVVGPNIYLDEISYNYTIDGHPASVGHGVTGFPPMEYLILRLDASSWNALGAYLRTNYLGNVDIQNGVAKLVTYNTMLWCWYTYSRWSNGSMYLDYHTNINYFTTHQGNWTAYYDISTGVLQRFNYNGELELVLQTSPMDWTPLILIGGAVGAIAIIVVLAAITQHKPRPT